MKGIVCLSISFFVMIGVFALAPSNAQAESETYEVIIKELNYHPPDLMITAGDTVVWENTMTYGHWVISGRDYRHDNRFFSPILLKGGKFSFTFREPGEFAYYCPIHNMQAVVFVLEPEDVKPEELEKYGQRRRIR